MSWLNKISQQINYDTKYPMTGNVVSELFVRDDVPNEASIDGYFEDYEILKGVREFPMSDLGSGQPRDVFYAADDIRRSRRLAEDIQQSKEISPLIIGIEPEGAFIIEGVHRFVALTLLGVQSFPAIIVISYDNNENETKEEMA